MAKSAKPGYYAVARGHVPGIYTTWAECQHQVSGFMGNKHQKFPTVDQAKAFLAQHGVATDSASSAATVPVSVPVPRAGPSRPERVNRRAAKPYVKPNGVPAEAGEKPKGAGSSRWAALTTEVIEDESGWDVVYSDGACKGNGKVGSVAGVGVWWGENDARNIAERCPGAQTNNRAELIAIVRVLETAPRTKRPLLIKTDSKYSISCFREWMPKWLKNGFKSSTGEPVKNAPLIRYLSALLDFRAREGQKIHLQYVKGHAGIEGNEGADQLANIGATMAEESERDWDKLLDVLQDEADKLAARPQVLVLPTAPAQDELEAYAAGLLADDDEELLAEIAAS